MLLHVQSAGQPLLQVLEAPLDLQTTFQESACSLTCVHIKQETVYIWGHS